MDKRRHIPNRQSGKPSKLLMGCALIIALSLPYFLVKNFSHHINSGESMQSVSLPKLEQKPVQEQSAVQEQKPTQEQFAVQKPKPVQEQIQSVRQIKAEPASKVFKDNEWQIIKPRAGDSLASIFNRLGLSAKNLQLVLQKNPHAKVLSRIKPSQNLQFLINKNKLEKLIIPVDNIQSLVIYKAGSIYKTKIISKKVTTQESYVTATVRGSLYSTAQRLNIPSKLIRQMTTILNREIDFSHSIRSGDQFSIIYESYYVEDKKVGTGDIIAVSYTNRGKTAQALRHTSASGVHNYYTPKGESFKKAFSRYPIKFSHISSTFASSRYHPILRYKRAHKGIDLAAPIGTPILATGDGVITIIGRHNGYGNMIEIKHDKPYSTIYGHMLKFQKGLSKGSKVKRGQVIGYVGQTGLATGPHCHYEVHVNNQPRNPTTINLPTASPVPARELAAFKSKANRLFARLKLFEKANLASASKKHRAVG